MDENHARLTQKTKEKKSKRGNFTFPTHRFHPPPSPQVTQFLEGPTPPLIWSGFQLCIDFPINSKQDAPFHCFAYDYSRTDWDGLHHHLRDVPWEDIFKLSASAASSKFREWVQVGLDVYIPHRKYQVKPHSSPWFSAASATAIVHRNFFFFFFCINIINLLNLK